MSQEEKIIQDLINKFSYLAGNIKIQRPRRIYSEISLDNFLQIFEFVVKQLNFCHLCTITGLDEQENLGFIYHLAQDCGIIFNLKIKVPKNNPILKSVIAIFPGAEIYERELADLLGAKIEGLPADNRYPLTDDWPVGEFPLRKDWKPKNRGENLNA